MSLCYQMVEWYLYDDFALHDLLDISFHNN